MDGSKTVLYSDNSPHLAYNLNTWYIAKEVAKLQKHENLAYLVVIEALKEMRMSDRSNCFVLSKILILALDLVIDICILTYLTSCVVDSFQNDSIFDCLYKKRYSRSST